jgi:hypothetical protein
MMEAVRTSETSVDNHFTRQYNPEDSSEHHTRRRENLKSHTFFFVIRKPDLIFYSSYFHNLLVSPRGRVAIIPASKPVQHPIEKNSGFIVRFIINLERRTCASKRAPTHLLPRRLLGSQRRFGGWDGGGQFQSVTVTEQLYWNRKRPFCSELDVDTLYSATSLTKSPFNDSASYTWRLGAKRLTYGATNWNQTL